MYMDMYMSMDMYMYMWFRTCGCSIHRDWWSQRRHTNFGSREAVLIRVPPSCVALGGGTSCALDSLCRPRVALSSLRSRPRPLPRRCARQTTMARMLSHARNIAMHDSQLRTASTARAPSAISARRRSRNRSSNRQRQRLSSSSSSRRKLHPYKSSAMRRSNHSPRASQWRRARPSLDAPHYVSQRLHPYTVPFVRAVPAPFAKTTMR